MHPRISKEGYVCSLFHWLIGWSICLSVCLSVPNLFSFSQQTQTTGSDPEYEQKIQFAVKLGYTEEQLQTALAKLGPQHTQNDLLAELIKLGELARAETEYEGTTGKLYESCICLVPFLYKTLVRCASKESTFTLTYDSWNNIPCKTI